MSERVRVLIIEDSEDDAALLVRELRRAKLDPQWRRVETGAQLREALRDGVWDLILADYVLPTFSALDGLQIMHDLRLDLPFIVVSGKIGEDVAVEAMRMGAHDYILKNNLTRLTAAVERELREAQNRRDQRQMELELLEKRKMETLGRLAGGIAHDFNNLLTVMYAHVDSARSLAGVGESPGEDLDKVDKVLDSARDLTRQLLAYTRRRVIQPMQLDLNALAGDIETMLRSTLGPSVRFATALDPHLPHVRADRGQMSQAIINLILNARDAIPGGGSISLNTRREEVQDFRPGYGDQVPPGSYVVISVADSGSGIAEKDAAHVLEPFFTTKAGKGTGLGLASTYGTIKQARGFLRFTSTVGIGTTFEMYLPSVGPEVPKVEHATAPVERPVRPSRGKLILVVEDDERIRRLFERVLMTEGYSVVAVDDSHAALELLSRKHGEINLLISDQTLSEVCATELLRSANDRDPDFKLLLTASYLKDADDQTSLPINASFLEKPFLPDQLRRTVLDLIGPGSGR